MSNQSAEFAASVILTRTPEKKNALIKQIADPKNGGDAFTTSAATFGGGDNVQVHPTIPVSSIERNEQGLCQIVGPDW